jgi:hypothetical protein
MNTGPLPTFGYPPAGGRRYMANGQFPWLTHFSQQDAPGFAWRTENTKERKKTRGISILASSLGSRHESASGELPQNKDRDDKAMLPEQRFPPGRAKTSTLSMRQECSAESAPWALVGRTPHARG